ncbi:MAG: hypothetical protein AABX23_03285 [Nanoarchaeota archaeon]
MNFKDRKGAVPEGILYIPFLITLTIIAAGLIGGLVAFYGKGYDYRFTESNLILEEAKDCFVREGFFDLNSIDKNSFFEKCDVSQSILEDGKHFVYLKNSKGAELSIGVEDFKVRCFLDTRFRNRGLPLCAEFKSQNGNYILVGSSQSPRRVLA